MGIQGKHHHLISRHPNRAGGIKLVFKYIVAVLAISAMISCGRNEPLSNYEPKSPEEQALKKFFMEFQEGVNRKDADKIANLIHENAVLMVGRERKILARPEYVKILPKRLAENPPISLGKPKMKVAGNAAEVKIYMTRGDYNGLMVYNMKLEKDQWYILNWRY